MAKRFKLKLSGVIPSFQLCRSKKPSNLPEAPVPAIHLISPVNPKPLDIGYPNFPAPPPSTPDYSFIKRHLSPKIASVGCGCRARSCTDQYLSPDVSFKSPDYSWKKEATRLNIVAKAQKSKLQRKNYEAPFSDGRNGDISVKKKEKKMEKVKAIASVSSRDSGCFTSEEAENEETETLISTSRSFLDDSSSDELDQSLESLTEGSHMETKKNKKKANNTKKMKGRRSFGSKKYRGSNSMVSKTKTSGALSSENSMLRRMMPSAAAEGKVWESVAVVKKSEDPYEDFKRSMLEMIMEKQMFEAKDLEQLLQCFLSLNSRQYHGIIVEAFTEIWEALFCDYPMNCL
ncbi:transcription repressor OFP7 [Herrania umbratica]|uniref:Transcription repressor n=1 Tax=Herrania umbratica TaxID=108875 RepID=A0A6J1ACX6_9ROSI|nr:transcription repressor OFP7 [Herrania umbratica]